MRLKNRVAIVTAAAGAGIGQATARMMAREGTRIVVTDMHKERTHAVAKAIQGEYGVETMGIQCDVTRLDEVRDVVKITLEKFGRIDILFNNAGTNRPVQVADMSDETWELVINTSLKGTFYFSRAVLPAMMEQKAVALSILPLLPVSEGWAAAMPIMRRPKQASWHLHDVLPWR